MVMHSFADSFAEQSQHNPARGLDNIGGTHACTRRRTHHLGSNSRPNQVTPGVPSSLQSPRARLAPPSSAGGEEGGCTKNKIQ